MIETFQYQIKEKCEDINMLFPSRTDWITPYSSNTILSNKNQLKEKADLNKELGNCLRSNNHTTVI